MSRLSFSFFLLFALILTCNLICFVQSQDADATPSSTDAGAGAGAGADGGDDATNTDANADGSGGSEPKGKPFPYARPKPVEGALNLGEGQSLALPPWLLYIVLILILSGVGFVVYQIFTTQAEKERKKVEKIKLKDERRAKKSGSKKKE